MSKKVILRNGVILEVGGKYVGSWYEGACFPKYLEVIDIGDIYFTAKTDEGNTSHGIIHLATDEDYGHDWFPYIDITHGEGKALDIEIEQQAVAQNDVWKHDDFRDSELERIDRLMDIHTNACRFYNDYSSQDKYFGRYVDLTYKKVEKAVEMYIKNKKTS